MTATEKIDKALTLTRNRLIAAPGFQLYLSSVSQLEYLSAVVRGIENDRARLKYINVGHFATREFEESDPELADALSGAQYIADKLAKGLKV